MAATHQMVALVRLIVQMSSKVFSHNLINESVELPSWRQNGLHGFSFLCHRWLHTLAESRHQYICAQTKTVPHHSFFLLCHGKYACYPRFFVFFIFPRNRRAYKVSRAIIRCESVTRYVEAKRCVIVQIASLF